MIWPQIPTNLVLQWQFSGINVHGFSIHCLVLHSLGVEESQYWSGSQSCRYNSGAKSFTRIHTKHLTVTIDAFTIQNSLWSVKKPSVPQRRDLWWWLTSLLCFPLFRGREELFPCVDSHVPAACASGCVKRFVRCVRAEDRAIPSQVSLFLSLALTPCSRLLKVTKSLCNLGWKPEEG